MKSSRKERGLFRIKRRAQAHENSSERNPIHTEPTRNLQRNSGLKPSVWLRQHVIQHCVSETGAKHPLHGETLPQYADRAASLSLYVSKSTLTRGHCQIYRDIKRLPLWFLLKNPTVFLKPVSLYMCYKFKKKKHWLNWRCYLWWPHLNHYKPECDYSLNQYEVQTEFA